MNLSRKTKIFITSIAAAAALTASSLAYNSVSVRIDGTYAGIDTYYEQGCTYVPLRAFYNKISDASISWNGATKSAHVEIGNSHAVFTEGKNYMNLNGKRLYNAGSNKIINGTMYVPIRLGAEHLGYNVCWNASSSLADLTSGSYKPSTYTNDEIYWLSRIIYAEAGGESYEGMLAVGNVILNRVAHKDYPNTIYGVIFDKKYGVQFSPVSNGTIYNTPSADAINAAKDCLNGTTVVSSDCIYFLNPDKSTSFWIVENCEYLKTIGCHDFYA